MLKTKLEELNTNIYDFKNADNYDYKIKKGLSKEIVEENLSALNKLLEFYLQAQETIKPLPKLIDGNDVMQILKIKPSPILGEILNSLHEAQISGDVTTKEEAISFVKNYPIR